MENEKNAIFNGLVTILRRLYSTFRYRAYWVKLLCGYLIILISAIPFYFGYQIYPVDNLYHQSDMNPECLSISQIGYNQEKNFFNLSYSLNTNDMMTRDISFGLFRILVNGQFYKEELRRKHIASIFQYQNDLYSISFELFQEGQTNFTIKCLDRDLFSKDLDIQEIQSTKYTVFHKDNSLSNLCFSNGEKIIFVRNNVKNFSSKTKNALSPFIFTNTSAEEFILENDKNFYFSSYPVIEIYQRTTFELLSKILPYAFYLSQINNNNQFFDAFMVNSNLDESNELFKFVRSIVKESIVRSNNTFTDYCYMGDKAKLFNYPIYHKFQLKTIETDSKKAYGNDKFDDQIDLIYNSFQKLLLSKYGSDSSNKSIEKPKIVLAINSLNDFTNIDDLRQFFSSNENFKIINLSELTLQQKIFELSNTSILISTDDNNEVSNAIWMPNGSMLILIHEKNKKLSRAIQFIKDRKIEVILADFYPLFEEDTQKVDIPLKTIEMILKDL